MRIAAGSLAGVLLLAACRHERVTWDALNERTNAASWAASRGGNTPSAEVNKELAALRRATAKFRSLESAKAAGWTTEITGCMTDPKAGGMGYHYGNPKPIEGSGREEGPGDLLQGH